MNQVLRIDSETTPVAKVSSEEGRLILASIRLAMSNATLEKIAPERIRPMNGQPRTTLLKNLANPDFPGYKRLEKLAESIKSSGQMMPGIIRRIPRDAEGHDFELCDGERRYQAVLLGGIATYRALVIDIDTAAAQYVVSIISNFNRESHTTLELVDSIVKMHDKLGLTFIEIADAIGIGSANVGNLYNLHKLVPQVRDMLDPMLVKGKTLPLAAAYKIAQLPSAYQLSLATKVMSKEIRLGSLGNELVKVARKSGMSVRKIEPRETRRQINDRINLLSTSAGGLKNDLQRSDSVRALGGYTIERLEELEKQLGSVAQDFVTCHEILEQLIKKQKILLKK